MPEESLHVVCPHCSTVNRIFGQKLKDAPNCGQIPVLVDFWAPRCAPCRQMAPAFEQAAAQLEPRVRLVKVDTEAEQQLAARFNIRSIPTMAIFKNGREIARQSGALDLGSLKRWIQPHLHQP